AAWMFHAPCDRACRLAVTPIDVAADDAADRSARVLHHQQPIEVAVGLSLIGSGRIGLEPYRNPKRMNREINRKARFRGERHAFRAKRPDAWIAKRLFPEKHI